MSIRIFIYLFLISISGCSFAERESVIKGTSHTYRIPEEFIKINDSIMDAKGISGDIAKSVSLIIPASRFSTDSKNDLSVLLFLDRDYSRTGDFGQFARNMLKEARKIEASDEYWFLDKLGSRAVKYHSSFDPFAEVVEPNRDDYFVQVIEPEVIEIPGVRVLRPKTTCKIWFINDGILFQVVAFEKRCSNRSYDLLLNSRDCKSNCVTAYHTP